ncbi:protein FAR-RED IMPAIRED RESPONSE 1-like [Camellia sinensis]|uniref:protein FAR-RED IMPAIRED RESPONSE 1-like n=1 Tax=Camellia sinensis TaxID=4442 RepID=UPI0010366213|nr:protein FAR-RED IMPAIRED RESPONSE 1-like [Camellia sinensis]
MVMRWQLMCKHNWKKKLEKVGISVFPRLSSTLATTLVYPRLSSLAYPHLSSPSSSSTIARREFLQKCILDNSYCFEQYQITRSHLSSEFLTQSGKMEVDSNVGKNPLINEGKHVEEPKKGMCFSSREEVYTFYEKYAKHVGFSIAHKAQHFGDDGLLSSEDTNTFVWLFKSWLSCIPNHPPKAIITDQCRAMQNAIEIVFPQARHRWCLWHIMKKISEKLKGYAQYEAIKLAMQNAIYNCLTRAKFESKWEEMLATFNLYDNEWLGVLYDEQNRWVPVYVKDIFWASMSTTQRSESMNTFFDGYVNPKTTLKQLVEQYDNALRNKVEKEKKTDFKSRHKLFDCLTIYGFEKQFQQTYTNAKFKEVQGELKRLVYCQVVIVKDEGSISTYNVQEAMVVSEKMKHVDFVVYFNSTEYEVQCICRLFEFRGIMCAHSLAVLVRR